jgi:hypothetical protein
VVLWRFIAHLDNGKSYVSDGYFLIETSYFIGEELPDKIIPATAVERLLQWPTTHAFGIDDLESAEKSTLYWAPRKLLLNGAYIDYAKDTPLKAELRFEAGDAIDPVLICDGSQVIGAVMPVKLHGA